MPELSRFLLEFDRPRLRPSEIQTLGARSRTAAAEMRREGATIRFLRAIYVPEDARCFLLFEGESARDVDIVAGRVGVAFSRLVEAKALELPAP